MRQGMPLKPVERSTIADSVKQELPQRLGILDLQAEEPVKKIEVAGNYVQAMGSAKANA
jgi:hypothetical protein